MKAHYIVLAALCVLTAALTFNQLRLFRSVSHLASAPARGSNTGAETADTRLRDTETRLNEAKTQLEIAEQKLVSANAQIAQLDQRLRQLENNRSRGRMTPSMSEPTARQENPVEPTGAAKRGWGPEQATGEPDTLQAGDISTAWAPLEQDAGEEWLKLDYENAVEVAEIRVRETHNPGAISKITAFLANGMEIILWAGVEPQAAAPVEMSFQVPDSVNTKSVKVYLDTKRIPGWNEIDAVELIGRDGSHQWAKQASASSTYAQPHGQRLIEQEVLRL